MLLGQNSGDLGEGHTEDSEVLEVSYFGTSLLVHWLRICPVI